MRSSARAKSRHSNTSSSSARGCNRASRSNWPAATRIAVTAASGELGCAGVRKIIYTSIYGIEGKCSFDAINSEAVYVVSRVIHCHTKNNNITPIASSARPLFFPGDVGWKTRINAFFQTLTHRSWLSGHPDWQLVGWHKWCETNEEARALLHCQRGRTCQTMGKRLS